jgi:hypothetical protein
VLAISCTFCEHHLAFSAHCQPYIFFSLPKHHEVANAVGAAIASVSGEVDTIEILEGRSISDVLENIKQRAVDRAVESGAQPGSVRIVDINVLPVQVRDFPSACVKHTCSKKIAQYVTNQATRIIVRAVGELSQESAVVALDDAASHLIDEDEGNEPEVEAAVNTPTQQERVDYATYKPTIVGKEWILSETDLCDFSLSFHSRNSGIDHFWFFI